MMFAIDLLEPQRARLLRWAGAAVFVVVAHVAFAALALMPWQEDDAEDAAASPVIVEMVPAATATPVDSPDVAHGPLMEEAMLTPQAAKETKEEVEKEMPTVEPSPAPDPEVVLPTPHPVTDKKPDEEKPQEDTPKQQSADQVVAIPLTMAPPRVEAKEEPAAAAPSPGISAAAARAQAAWEKALVSHLNRFKRYPDVARARSNQGDVAVEFTIDRMGTLVASRVMQSSGSSVLDEEALAVLHRASPLPAPPAQVSGTTFDLKLPIQFRIR
jgi:periplasmic protein TonB